MCGSFQSGSASGRLFYGFKGGAWSSSLLFYEYLPDGRVIFGEYGESAIKSKLLPLLDPVDQIESLYVYKSLLPYQSSTDTILHHEFLVAKTSKWYYSWEKNEAGIILQRSVRLKDIVRRIQNEPRQVDPADFEELTFVGRFLFRRIINWIQLNGEVKKRYNLLASNCQIFVSMFRKAFTV